MMENTLSKGGANKRRAGSSAPVGANGREALTRAARQQYQLGNYASSAAAYERALKSGGDTGSLNQRLGQAYERLGRTGDAASAYERAARAHEAALASGKGDKERTKAALDSCRQALKVLKGS